MGALGTDAIAVGVPDRRLNVAFSDDGVRKCNVVGETAAPDHRENRGELLKKLHGGGGNRWFVVKPKFDQPVVDEEVVFLATQPLPHIRLLPVLTVQRDVL